VSRRFERVSLNGEAYIPAEERPLDMEARELLHDIYGSLWMEAFYDPANEATRTFAEPLARKMKKLNEMLGFKQ
jgi:hypothetical protein